MYLSEPISFTTPSVSSYTLSRYASELMVKRIDAKFLSATSERSCETQKPLSTALALMSLASPWEQSIGI